jgi:hypothetical protein
MVDGNVSFSSCFATMGSGSLCAMREIEAKSCPTLEVTGKWRQLKIQHYKDEIFLTREVFYED